jgi:hypothetical protein
VVTFIFWVIALSAIKQNTTPQAPPTKGHPITPSRFPVSGVRGFGYPLAYEDCIAQHYNLTCHCRSPVAPKLKRFRTPEARRSFRTLIKNREDCPIRYEASPILTVVTDHLKDTGSSIAGVAMSTCTHFATENPVLTAGSTFVTLALACIAPVTVLAIFSFIGAAAGGVASFASAILQQCSLPGLYFTVSVVLATFTNDATTHLSITVMYYHACGLFQTPSPGLVWSAIITGSTYVIALAVGDGSAWCAALSAVSGVSMGCALPIALSELSYPVVE